MEGNSDVSASRIAAAQRQSAFQLSKTRRSTPATHAPREGNCTGPNKDTPAIWRPCKGEFKTGELKKKYLSILFKNVIGHGSIKPLPTLMFERQRIHGGTHVTLVRVLVVQNLVTWSRVAAKVSSRSPAGYCVSPGVGTGEGSSNEF